MIKLSSINPSDNNPRKISDQNLEKLCKSIKEFPKMMELRPLIIDADNTIIGGNMRYQALIKLGYKEIPEEWVKRAEELTEEEKKRFVLTDNISFGEWDATLLHDWDFTAIGIEPPISMEAIEKYKGTDDQFAKDFENIKDKDAQIPIVPEFMEKYSAFIIITKNEIDELYVKNVLKLTEPAGNKVKLPNRIPNIITVEQLKKAFE
jgi:hypothetical protein